MKRLLCLIGLHRWAYPNDEDRYCRECNLTQYVATEDDRGGKTWACYQD
jgi:hypothetical protein